MFNSVTPILHAALAGAGLAYLTEDPVAEHLASGQLIEVHSEWSPPFPGYHLYYPSRRQPTPAFEVVGEALRYRPPRPKNERRKRRR